MSKKQRSLTVVCILFITANICAQDFKFGKVSKEELEDMVYEKDSSAAAAVLYRKENIGFGYVQSDGFKVVTKIHQRIKIYNKDGFDYATIAQNLYKSSSKSESISGLKAVTYNLEGGKIVGYKLKKSDVFRTSMNKNYNQEKFTMPNVKEGSVIEYQYTINSPYPYSLDEIVLQYDIPIARQEIKLGTPEYFSFKPNMKGYLQVMPKYSSSTDKIVFVNRGRSDRSININRNQNSTTYSTSQLDYRINKTMYKMADVPALKEEPYVNDMDNYRSTVNYELQYTQFPRSARKSYSTTWEKVVKTIYDSKNFGDQIDLARYYKDDLEAILSTVSSDTEKIAAIFSHVQQRMSWNEYRGYYTDKGVKAAYKEKSGNTADINLILVSMLKKAGLDANPVLISTRDHGLPLFPTREGYNYVVASVNLNGNIVLLDASNKYTKPNLLPTRALNWYGRIVKEDRTSSTVDLFPQKLSKEISMLSMAIAADGEINGKLRKTYTDYSAYIYRNRYAAIDEEDYLEKLEAKNGGMEISDYSVKNNKTIGKPVVESYGFLSEDQAEVIGDKIYFSPMMNFTTKENPFKLEERNYPIDYTYPREQKFILNIDIPEGYQILSKPQDVSLGLIENMGSFVYKVSANGNKMQVLMNLKINKAVIPAGHYEGLKELYKKMIEKETEKVVLSKI